MVWCTPGIRETTCLRGTSQLPPAPGQVLFSALDILCDLLLLDKLTRASFRLPCTRKERKASIVRRNPESRTS